MADNDKDKREELDALASLLKGVNTDGLDSLTGKTGDAEVDGIKVFSDGVAVPLGSETDIAAALRKVADAIERGEVTVPENKADRIRASLTPVERVETAALGSLTRIAVDGMPDGLPVEIAAAAAANKAVFNALVLAHEHPMLAGLLLKTFEKTLAMIDDDGDGPDVVTHTHEQAINFANAVMEQRAKAMQGLN